MKAFGSNNNSKTKIVRTYEKMSQNGSVGFLDINDFLNIISYYQDISQLEKALKVVDEAINQHPFSSDLFLLKAQIFLELEAFSYAMISVDKAQSLAPNNVDAILLKAELLVTDKQADEALGILHVLEYENDLYIQSEIAYIKALIAEQDKDYYKQFDYLTICLLQNPENKAAYEKMWLSIQLNEMYIEGQELFSKLIEKDPFNKDAWFHLGQVHSTIGDYKKALEALEYSFLIDNTFIKGYRECALVAMEAEEYRKSLYIFEEMLKQVNPTENDILNIGKCYLEMSSFEVAKSFFLKVLVKNPKRDQAYHLLSICESNLQNTSKAIMHILQAIRFMPENEEYFALLAEYYFKEGNVREAKNAFQKAVDTAPDSVFVWIQYISFLIDLNDLVLARQILEEAEDNTYGTELLYAKFCISYMEKQSNAFLYLEKALVENFDLHKIIFQILPELEYSQHVQQLLQASQS